MMGLAYLGAAALFLTVMFWVMYWAWQRGRANGGSVGRASAFAFAGFLVVYLPVFWNWIPVVLTHRNLCSSDAGFTVYVTPEQWVAENRGQFGSLAGVDLDETTKSLEPSPGTHRYEFFGGLLTRENNTKRFRRYGMNFLRGESRIVDSKSNVELTRRVNYTVGPREDARIWLPIRSCFELADDPLDKEILFTSKLKEAVK